VHIKIKQKFGGMRILDLQKFVITQNWCEITLTDLSRGGSLTVNRPITSEERRDSLFFTTYFLFQQFLADFERVHGCISGERLLISSRLLPEARLVLSLAGSHSAVNQQTPLVRLGQVQFPRRRVPHEQG